MRLYRLYRRHRPHGKSFSHEVCVEVKLKDKTLFYTDSVTCFPEEIRGIFNEHKDRIKKNIEKHKRELG